MPTSEVTGRLASMRDAGCEQLLILDSQLQAKAANDAFYAAFQVSPRETLGKKLTDIDKGQWNIPALLTRLSDLLTLGREFDDFEIEHASPTQGKRSMLVGGRRLAGEDAEGELLLVSIRDALLRRPSETDQRNGFRTILCSIADAVIVTDLESRITFMNRSAEGLTGWLQQDAMEKQVTDVFRIMDERSSQVAENPVTQAIQEGAKIGLTNHTILIARDDSEWPIEASAAPIVDEAGRLAGVVLVFRDISNRRQAEQDLELSEIRYRRLFETAHDGILILEVATAKVLDVNPFMTILLGYPKQHFLQKELWEIGVFKDAEVSKAAMAKLQRLGRIRYDDLPLQHREGAHIPVEFVSNVYREGRRTVIQCNIRDISERKLLATKLIEAMAGAEAANRSKSEFLANMSHEIRTPMNAILGFVEMLISKTREECEELGCVQIIRRNAMHLLQLVNDILDLSKIEAGQMRVERASVDLPALLSEIVSVMQPRAIEKGLAFALTFRGPIPRLIQSDSLRLREIFLNLLGNAVKFTESGRIDVLIVDEGVGGPNIALRVDFIDTGIGMTQEQGVRLFSPFTQADSSITRKFGGTGLGLTISRRLARLLNGDITFTSQSDVGSTFTLTIDGGPSIGAEYLQGLKEATLPATARPEKQAESDLQGRILLVEDGADNQWLLQLQLGYAGAEVVLAQNGAVAVDLAATQQFDLILMDMQMPVMDGYAATAELRRRGLTIPIIALTAYAIAEDRDKCLASGCTDYLSKPVDEETLLRTIKEYLAKISSSMPDDSAAAGVAGPTAPAAADPSSRIKSSFDADPRMTEIIRGFIARLPAQVLQMTDFLKRKDLDALGQLVHQLLGAAGGYGFAAVSRPALTIEQSIRGGKPLESIAAETKSLIELIRRIDGYNEPKVSLAAEEQRK